MDDHVVEDQSAVFHFLADPASHGLAEPVRRIDTHGAAVFLAGPYAYKVKRAVAFPFMDFSTLARRKAACGREVAINGANAPGLYLDVVPITRGPAGLALGGTGAPVDYAVRMRRFDEGLTLDKVAQAGLSPDLCARLASRVAAAHQRAQVRPDFPSAAHLARIAQQNADDFRADPALFPPAEAAALDAATQDALKRGADLLAARAGAGFVRRCHGDLHLRNIVLLDGVPTLFDAIEFNDDLATCDLLYDFAFLLMDLWERGLHGPANLVLNRYLWAQDADAHYEGLALLPLFLSLRAGIRAKVEAAGLGHLPPDERDAARARSLRQFRAAQAFLAPSPLRLVAVGGLSGTGKSTLAAALAPQLGRAPGAVVLRSDITRKALAGVGETDRLPADAYKPGTSEAVYEVIRRRAGLALAAGQCALLDAVHARPHERAAAAALAQQHCAGFTGLWLEAPVAELEKRVEARRGDASDATADVVRTQSGYETGPMDWHRLDSSGDRAALTARALDLASGDQQLL
ncbi:AAA family ATPase [Aquabacter sp. L1I39]|uniref:bifunctional aminoglycoside phosphotransferase/ATP-binding protein n=1 Tax=Aquabacter sp. L1I39 TaxID=2820278 RepID=UPI001ADC606C|nr:bifunctional aminoglycoside phosphotransferase/ATP-binding protein [Aquabacter sp. L1I39]QTL05459.1 AAA family ATPase [Aquabacter sp. L1I39]